MARRSLHAMRCLVTGASSGIGAALARELATAGALLVLTARRSERLSQLADELQQAGGRASWLAGDITSPETRRHALALCESEYGGLDILINNAGAGAYGPFATADEARLRWVLDVNFFAAAELTRAAIPLLRRGQRPLIVNIGSVLGHRAVPNKSEYCAAKFALHGWSDALRAELAFEGIDVMLASPSTTSSEFFEHVRVAEGDRSPPAPGRRSGGMRPATVARRIVTGMRRGRHEIILSAGGKLLVWLDRLCPPLMNRLIAWWER